MKRVLIVHGWGGSPDEGWIPWLKSELEERRVIVETPMMPNTNEPKIEEWVPALAKLVVQPDEKTFLVGHSIGVQAIFRYLAGLSSDAKIGGVVCVAGWFNLPNLKTQEEREIAKPWLTKPIDDGAVKRHTKKIIAIFSDDDPDVPISDAKLFRDRLNAEIIVEHHKGHFSPDVGVTELPVALKKILTLQANGEKNES